MIKAEYNTAIYSVPLIHSLRREEL